MSIWEDFIEGRASGEISRKDLHLEQQASWERGAQLTVEMLLEAYPALRSDPDAMLDLLQHEIALRQEAGERPHFDEYAKRFPDYRQRLAQLLSEDGPLENALAEALEESLYRDQTLQVDDSESDERGAKRRDDSDSPARPGSVAHESRPSAPAKFGEETPSRGRFGDYELLEEVARGGMGIVYRACQLGANRTVALKMVLAGDLASESEILRFQKEAEAAARLDHPNIVPIFDVGQHEGRHFFSMGFVDGPSLANRLASSGPLDPAAAAAMMIEIAEAIHYAHEQGILHRDLKPANILLTDRDQPRITDFGLAKQIGAADGLTMTGDIVGTPSYMAPEQAAGLTNRMGRSSDIYSLGAVLYCLLVGRPPFQAANIIDTLNQVINRDPISPRQLNASVDRDLETICLKCLEKDPTRRYDSAQTLADELKRYLAGAPILARPVGTLERARRWCRRQPVVAGLTSTAAVLVVALIASLAIGYLRESSLRQTAQSARNDAHRSAVRARQQATVAMETLESVIYEIQDRLAQVPAAESVRRQLLRTTLRRLDKVAATFRSGQRISHDEAFALIELGDLYARAGSDDDSAATDAATRHFTRAATILEAIQTREPENHSATHDLTVAFERLGDMALERGELPQAQRRYQQVHALRKKLVDAQPDHPTWQRSFAVSLSKLGQIATRQNQFAEAESHHSESRAQLRRLLDRIVTSGTRKPPAPAADPDSTSSSFHRYNVDPSDLEAQLAVETYQLGRLHLRRGNMDAAEREFKEVLRLRSKAGDDDQPHQLDATRGVVSAYRQMGELYLEKAQLTKACDHFEHALTLARELHALTPENQGVRETLALAAGKRGELHLRVGEVTLAAECFDEERRIREQILEADPEDYSTARELAVAIGNCAKAYKRLGQTDKTRAYLEQQLQFYRQLTEQAPSDHEAQNNLAVAYQELGGLCWEMGDLAAAREHYSHLMQYEQRYASDRPDDLDTQRGMVIALGRVGDVELASRKFHAAGEAYEKHLEIALKLWEAQPESPTYRRDVSIAYNRLGNLARDQNRAQEALQHFQQALEYARLSADDHPDDPRAASDLAVGWSQIGNTHLMLGDFKAAMQAQQASLDIRRRLASQTPDDFDAQRAVTVSLERLGDVATATSDFATALEVLDECRQIRETLVASDPANTLYLRDLSVVCDRQGIARFHQGELKAAAECFDRGYAISRQLVSIQSDNDQFTFDLIAAAFKVGNTNQQLGNYQLAADAFREGLEYLRKMDELGKLDHWPQFRPYLHYFEHHLQSCEQALEQA